MNLGESHNIIDPTDGELHWELSWKDCYLWRPETGGGGANRNEFVNVTAPGQLVVAITDEYDDFPDGVRLNTAASTATPFVTGLAALIFSINPDLEPLEVKSIIENTTDDIYHIPYNQPYLGQLGTGRINAYRAVLTAHCTTNPGGGLDLAMQNSLEDDFTEPDTVTNEPWTSDDIWVRNQDDGDLIDTHENPEYHPTIPKYVYVRVTNDSCITSDGTDELEVSWAKASTSLSWPTNWDGSLFMQDPTNGANILMGDEIDTVNIPSLEPGETALIKIPWLMPNPADYENINDQPWHFCLLARILSNDDPMTVVEDSHITSNVLNNNNIAWKNLTISLNATLLNEPATYNWYDSEGNLIHQGEDFEIIPTKSETYQLEVVATKDGFKDYDQVSISVPPHEIISITPNPSSNHINIDYFIQGASEAYLSIVNTSTAATSNYVLDLNQENITIDISSYQNGYYEVALITDNQVQDSETILKN